MSRSLLFVLNGAVFAGLLLTLAPAAVWGEEAETAQPVEAGQAAAGEEREEEEPPDPNRWELAPFPALGGDSDVGFKFGVNLSIAKLRVGYRPYRFRLGVLAVLSVKGAPDGGTDWPEHDYKLNLDMPGLLGGRLRITPEVGFERIVTAGYFGLDGLSSDDPLGRLALGGGRRYQYIRQQPVATLDLRWRPSDLPIELLIGAHFRYVLPDAYADSQLREDVEVYRRPAGEPVLVGFNRHALAMLRLGMLWDRRDHEVVPSQGTYVELSGRGGLGIPNAAEVFAFGGVTADLRLFVPLLDQHHLVFAGRLLVDLQFGDVPFYELSRVGTFARQGFCGAGGLRGSPEGRRQGELKMLQAFELRTLFARFRLFRIPMVFGMLVHFTAGQSWSTLRPELPFVSSGPSSTWSVGYALNLRWGEAIMVRIEVDYSPDATDSGSPIGFYFELGYAF